jgi:hypothetical protein
VTVGVNCNPLKGAKRHPSRPLSVEGLRDRLSSRSLEMARDGPGHPPALQSQDAGRISTVYGLVGEILAAGYVVCIRHATMGSRAEQIAE